MGNREPDNNFHRLCQTREILPSITAFDFDLIIVDEAHKMSATAYGDKINRTNRYKLERCYRNQRTPSLPHGYPHRGDPENFRLFLDLLEPGYFSTKELLANRSRTGTIRFSSEGSKRN
jgi:hypothetical protein